MNGLCAIWRRVVWPIRSNPDTPVLTPETKARLRTWLILGRVSNLPTVWSNCLAGWLLGGGGSVARLLLGTLGSSFLYVGGMFLNDAFDAEFDRQHRKERPIPSGKIPELDVWILGIGWLILGLGLLVPFGKSTAFFAIALVGCILVYDWIHKAVAFSPLIMAGCRFFLLLLAASLGQFGIQGLVLWSAIVLFCYIVGLSYIARTESTRGVIGYWPCYLLAIPVVLAFLANTGRYRFVALVFCCLLATWTWRCLRHTFGGPGRNVGMTVSGLLAGIVLVDILAVLGGSFGHTLLFLIFFAAAFVFQRHIPAT